MGKEESFKLFHDDEEKDYNYLYKEANKAFCIENYNIALAHYIKLKKIMTEENEFDLKLQNVILKCLILQKQ